MIEEKTIFEFFTNPTPPCTISYEGKIVAYFFTPQEGLIIIEPIYNKDIFLQFLFMGARFQTKNYAYNRLAYYVYEYLTTPDKTKENFLLDLISLAGDINNNPETTETYEFILKFIAGTVLNEKFMKELSKYLPRLKRRLKHPPPPPPPNTSADKNTLPTLRINPTKDNT